MKVAVVGVGQTRMGEIWEKSLRDLSLEAGSLALQDAGLEGKDIEALFIGNMSAGRFIGQEHLGALMTEQAGLLPIPATRCEAACASGALAFRKALFSILSGHHEIVMVGGAEKMTDLSTGQAVATLASAGDQEWESHIGLTFAGLYALMARYYMEKYGLTREELALVPVKNHMHAMKNPYAQYRYEITVEDVINSPMISDPLRLLDCSPISDGAAAIIIAGEKVAKKFSSPVWFIGGGHASDTVSLHGRKSLSSLSAAIKAAEIAYRQAGVKPKDIDMAEVHDCFSIAEIMAYEDLGFAPKGKGKELLISGETKIGGRMPVNTDGGLKVGHPVGATGIKQIIEIVRQLRGKACNQVRDAKIGLAHNVGGSGATAIVNIFSREGG
ncbi:MAG: thiolase domain-containing protein [Candidatus Aenigmarchaeota archaeon]|nr:thiolase domain-containing protein [Candidatus Aenigmarchaeota archaeon]